MKILYHILYPHGLGDDRFTYEGYKEAFEDLGHQFFALTEKDDLAETIVRLQPDIFIEEGGFLIDDLAEKISILKNFRQHGGKVVLHGAMFSELAKAIRNQEIIDYYFSEVDPTAEFPDFPARLFQKMHWLAASKKMYSRAQPMKKYECDIMYVGANLPKKREAFESLLLPLKSKYDVKIFGFGWDFLDSGILRPLGKAERKIFGSGLISDLRLWRQVPQAEEGSAYASAKISINFHEKQEGFDFRTINARTFKIPVSGGFEVCDFVPQIREFFSEDELVMPKNREEWFEKIDYYLKHESERRQMQAKATANALKNHTFHSRVETILNTLS